MGITVNKRSTLGREWVTVHRALSAELVGTRDARTVYKSGRLPRECNYGVESTFEAKEPPSAIVLRPFLFDVWGSHIRSINIIEVTHVVPGRKSCTGIWRGWSQSDVSTSYWNRRRKKSHQAEQEPQGGRCPQV